MSKFTVIVTKTDILYGMKANPTRCPIANSIRKNATKDVFVDVGAVAAKVYNPATKDLKIYALPDEARAFVHKFDNGEHVEPIEFDMEEMDHYGSSLLEANLVSKFNS